MRRVVGTMVGCCLGLALLCGSASGAGIITHAWMADDARAYVQSPTLRALLDANRAQLRSGAVYPDSGYVMSSRPGGDYGEEAHWPRFVEGYVAQLRSRADCGDLADPAGPCAPIVAHLLGASAHGMGDEAWDWLMEPASVDRGETYSPSGLGPIFGTGGTEAQMDMIAVGRHNRPTGPVPPLPSLNDLLATYAAIGRTDILPQPQIDGNSFSGGQMAAERGLAASHAQKVAEAMPWSATHMMVGPGGVTWAAKAIAASYDSIWGRLTGAPIPARVGNTFPADGQLAIAATGWTHDVAPGTRTGYARNRIVAALSDSPPFRRTTSEHQALSIPPGAMTLTQLGLGGSETPVAIRDGFPRMVPYGDDAGEHLIDLQPAADLAACTTYRVRVTSALLDETGAPFTPYAWTFRTGTGADGAPCPDDPPIPEPVDPLSNPYEPIPEPVVDPPVTTTPDPPATIPPKVPPTGPPPTTCRTTSLKVTIRTPKGATRVSAGARVAGARRSTALRIRRGRVTVPLSGSGKKTTLTVRARIARRNVVVTKVLPTCATRTKAISLTVKAPKRHTAKAGHR